MRAEAMNAGLVQHDLSRRAVLREWRFADARAYAPNAHDDVEVAWCTTGRLDYSFADCVMTLTPGAAVVIPAGVEHVTRVAERGTVAASVHVRQEAVTAAADAMGRRLREARVVGGSADRPSTLATLGALLARETGSDEGGEALLVESLTDAFVVEALRTDEPSRADEGRDPRVRRAVQMIHDRYADPLTVDALARTAHVSRFHFSRLFLVETGRTPYRYLLEVRMARAAELLRTRRCAVTEAAMSVGCNDLGRFGRMFRRAHGVTPSEYLRREAVQGGLARAHP
jgi:AraC-like DNA-binding protein